jgi:hypothetical protein
MPSLIDIRRRIRTVRNTQQITKAMKMVAAARLRRAQERVIPARPYAGCFEAALQRGRRGARDERLARIRCWRSATNNAFNLSLSLRPRLGRPRSIRTSSRPP